VTCNESLPGLQITNPDLQPEKSTNYTVGFIANPVRELKVSVDYWDIKVNQDIISASEAVSLGVPAESLLFPIVRTPPLQLQQVTSVNPVTGAYTTKPVLSPVGEIIYQAFPYVNATETHVNGIDVDLASFLEIGAAGRLTASLNYSHMLHYLLTSPSGITTDLAGTHGPTGVSGDTGNPKDRAVLSLGWERGPWEVTATVNYVGSFNLTDPSVGINTCSDSIINSGKWTSTFAGPASFCTVSSFTDVDLYSEYTLSKHLRVHAAILNLFDKPPPLDMQTYGGGGGASFDGAFHDAGAIGRFFNVGATYTF
jgi:iron complex outermembrane receptor protein